MAGTAAAVGSVDWFSLLKHQQTMHFATSAPNWIQGYVWLVCEVLRCLKQLSKSDTVITRSGKLPVCNVKLLNKPIDELRVFLE